MLVSVDRSQTMGTMTLYNEVCDERDYLPLIKLPINNPHELPKGIYLFLDLYCPAPECDCKNGIIDIFKVSKKTILHENKITLKNEPLVTLRFSWEKNPADWEIDVHSSRQNFKKTRGFLNLLKTLVKDSFGEKLKYRYSHFKQTIKEEARSLESMMEYKMETSKKIGRNDLCPCGSGKKYKKCCINLEKENNINNTKQKRRENRLDFKHNLLNTFKHEKRNVMLSEDNPELLKMSEVILEFIKEFLDTAQDDLEEKNAIALGCAAWNLALIKNEKERQKNIKDLYQAMGLPKESMADFEETIHYLIDKKLNEYADIERFIIDFQIRNNYGQIDLDIASTII